MILEYYSDYFKQWMPCGHPTTQAEAEQRIAILRKELSDREFRIVDAKTPKAVWRVEYWSRHWRKWLECAVYPTAREARKNVIWRGDLHADHWFRVKKVEYWK